MNGYAYVDDFSDIEGESTDKIAEEAVETVKANFNDGKIDDWANLASNAAYIYSAKYRRGMPTTNANSIEKTYIDLGMNPDLVKLQEDNIWK